MCYQEKLCKVKKYFLEQNFIVRDGLKYGVDFLLYTEDVDTVHSRYGVILNRNFTYLQLLSIQRTCNTARKELVLVEVIDNEIQCTLIERFAHENQKE